MTVTRFTDTARFWRSPLVPGADLLTAEYHDHAFAPHWHDEYNVSVIEAGAERYDYRGTQYVADTGAVPVINPGEVHTGSRAVEEGWKYRVFYLPVDYVHALANEVHGSIRAAPWFSADIVRDDDLRRRLTLAHRSLEANDDPLAAETALLDALSTLLLRHAGERRAPAVLLPDARRIEVMKERMADDLAAPLTLAELAASVGLSSFHAARLFSRAAGLAPHAWRNQMRLTRALGALRAGVSVTEVAAASGFTDQSHFTRHFKRAFGVPPGRWR
jgi:AraC-like DNA-binding protein